MKVISGFTRVIKALALRNAMAAAPDATTCFEVISGCPVPKPTHTRFNPVTGIEVEISLLTLMLKAPYLPLAPWHSVACSHLLLVQAESNRAPALQLAYGGYS